MTETQKGPERKEVFDDGTGEIITAAVEVHTRLGPGFVESIYEQALKIELSKRGVRFVCQKRITVFYDGQPLGDHVLDLLVNGSIVVELKAVRALEDVHYAQVKSYCRATGCKIGLLFNFGTLTLTTKRIYP